jgi:hypothetical protein
LVCNCDCAICVIVCVEFECDSVWVKPSWVVSEIGENLICVRVIPNWLWQTKLDVCMCDLINLIPSC